MIYIISCYVMIVKVVGDYESPTHIQVHRYKNFLILSTQNVSLFINIMRERKC